MMVFRLLGWVAFGAIFLAIAAFSANALILWKAKSDFMKDIEKFAGVLGSLANQSTGSSSVLKIHVPPDCSLHVDQYEIVVIAWDENKSLKSELELPTFTLGPGNYEIYVVRTDNGVDVLVR